MFNNLGLFSPRKPTLKAPVRRIPIAAPAQFGGYGNDFFLTGTLNVPGGQGPAGPTGPTGPIGLTGATGPTGPAGTVGLVSVTDVTTTPYNALLTDYYLAVDVAAAASIVLPVSPTGTVFIIKDIDGDAATNPITITASTTIDGAASATITADYGSVTLIFNGTEWNIV